MSIPRAGCLVSYGELSGSLPAVDLTDLMDNAILVTKFGGGGPDFGLEDLRATRPRPSTGSPATRLS